MSEIKRLADRARRGAITARMIWRWHFYAGLFCIPFVLILSITGPIYLFKPQIEAWIDKPYDHLTFAGAPQSAEGMVKAALRAVPAAHFKAIEVRPDDHDAARIILSQKGELIRVYVHPQSLAILKQVPEDQRFMQQVKDIHGELLTGKTGSIIVETAACWAIVMILSGLYLWWPRQAKGLAGVLYPRLNAGGRLFWRDLHAVVGIYVAAFALFLLFTGLPWTTVWGAGFKEVRKLTHTSVVKQDWAQGRSDEKKQRASEDGGEHANHIRAGQNMAGHDMGRMSGMPATSPLDGLDQMIVSLRSLDLPPPVILNAPSKKSPDWTAQSDTQNRPLRVTLTFDSKTGAVVKRQEFKDKHPIDQVVGVMIAAHEGQLFGWVNQALGLLTAIALITLCLSGLLMWLKRRPSDGSLGAPHALDEERIGWGLAALIIGLGVFLPLLGITLIIVALIEILILKRIKPVRDWLGLG